MFSDGNICDMLPGDNWVEVKPDGSRVPFEVPGRTDGEIVVETTLPSGSSFNKDYSALCFRGMDMDIYVKSATYTIKDQLPFPWE